MQPGSLHTIGDAASHYTHIRILMGMIVGLGLTHLLRQVARLIEHPGQRGIYWVHGVWAVFTFVYLLHFWWWQYHLSAGVAWTFNLYLFVTLYALLLYLLCALALPENMQGYHDYREYFFARRGWFFGLLALVFAVDLADTALKGHDYLQRLGPEYYWRNGVFIVACLAAARLRSARVHGAFAVLALAYEISWIARHYELMGS
ncbi:hypothetical protein [Pseudoxanthomonas dokdonensis]|nr:hypothetical protein [Pseudoxanthomonas dokdonensis]